MFETAIFLELMEAAQKRAHDNSVKHGFWDGPENCNIPTKLCLMHSEISEWLEAFRSDPKAPCGKLEVVSRNGGVFPEPLSVLEGGEHRPLTKEEEEAADLFIRLLDLCQYLKIDLARATLAKMRYNETRPHMHGGKKV